MNKNYGVRGPKNPYKRVRSLPTKGPQNQMVNPTYNGGKGPQGQRVDIESTEDTTENTE